ncbi:hypothetical protein CPB83DRAFT_235807 [Crepidotus variabilis]|uniref:Uncharacterized protein n=1 Tax=Crepidotus variabilis TaxID=179855 RepID=A0A9P6ETW3_9AGAR|nr:hypothetical protein CPB83DRAFT_235807 [Crepidotus variabilis]
MQSAAKNQDLADELVPLLVKELKSAKEKIKDLERELVNMRLRPEAESGHSNQVQDYKQRTEAAEHAMEVLQKNFEKSSKENDKLRSVIEGIKEIKVKVKQVIFDSVAYTPFLSDIFIC